MRSIRQCYITLYKRVGEAQWTIRHGWIASDDTESFREYLSTPSSCEEFHVVPSELRNNALHLFSEIRADFRN
jgi:hypothetical protein